MPTFSIPWRRGKLPAGGADLYRVSGDGGGLTCACAEFFAQYIPLSYRTLVFILGGFSMVVSNLGLSHLIQISIPVLTAIYPPCIALVVLSFTRSWWHNSTRIIAPAMFISLLLVSLTASKHLPLAICCQPESAFTAGGTGTGVVDANGGDGDPGDYLGSRGGSAGDLQRSLKSLTYVYTTGLNAPWFLC